MLWEPPVSTHRWIRNRILDSYVSFLFFCGSYVFYVANITKKYIFFKKNSISFLKKQVIISPQKIEMEEFLVATFIMMYYEIPDRQQLFNQWKNEQSSGKRIEKFYRF